MTYKSTVTEIGAIVPAFEEEMLIVLFGMNAPAALKEISVIHDTDPESEKAVIEKGSKIEMGGTTYTVLNVGSEAVANFEELGHISIYFKTEMNELLPGAVQVEPEVFPAVEVGQDIKFYK